MPSGRDPMGGNRFSEKTMLKQKDNAGVWFNSESDSSAIAFLV